MGPSRKDWQKNHIPASRRARRLDKNCSAAFQRRSNHQKFLLSALKFIDTTRVAHAPPPLFPRRRNCSTASLL